MAPQTDDDYVATYFPRTTDAAAAAPIDVAAGAQLRNIEIVLAQDAYGDGDGACDQRSPRGGKAAGTNLNVMLLPRNAMVVGTAFTRGAPVSPQGTFEFRGVTPGSYFVVAAAHTPGKSYTARTPIQVGSSNIEGISLTIRGGVAVTGRVRVEGETTESIAKIHVMLQPAGCGRHHVRSAAGPAGEGRRELSIGGRGRRSDTA